ncbi:hypothetical protein AB0E78_20925 [Streptomyces sp. NPDC032198]|uniref:hypothetical protein n=1 Tax=Streptomyces sp. NPDC032198 TaxID=3155127 RepID=UPI003402758F
MAWRSTSVMPSNGRSTSRMMRRVVVSSAVITVMVRVASRNQKMAPGMLAVAWVRRSSRSPERLWSAATSIPTPDGLENPARPAW